MAATPPLQIVSSPETPATPLYGAAYDRPNRYPTRQSARISQKRVAREFQATPEPEKPDARTNRSLGTPRSTKQTTQHSLSQLQSPRSTPKQKTTRRVQVISPESPNFATTSLKPSTSSNKHLQPFVSATTTINEGMLPTPVKTPRKKNITQMKNTARALFQDAAIESETLAPTPKRTRKNKRYNGFSLESFSAVDEENPRQIQIFTDSRDRVPELDMSGSNPFVEQQLHDQSSSSKRVAGTSKRRKVGAGRRRFDSQVEEAIKKDDGMVYVFRGKKVYKRFDDEDDEEEEIDTDDIGLLEHVSSSSSPVKPLKTLSRRSIKPTRLFQTEQQKRERQMQLEEEAPTDSEDVSTNPKSDQRPEKFDIQQGELSQMANEIKAIPEEFEDAKVIAKSKKGSPFDSWRRAKPASHASTVTTKAKKRGAAELLEPNSDEVGTNSATTQKKTRTSG